MFQALSKIFLQNSDTFSDTSKNIFKCKNGYYYFIKRYKNKLFRQSLKTKDLKIALIKRNLLLEEWNLKSMEDWKKSKLIIVPDTGKGETIEEAKAFERFINELKNTEPTKYQKMVSKGNNVTYKKLTVEKAFNDFLQYKERYKQLKEDTLNDYKTTYNYLMLFLDKTDDVLKINETFSIIFLDTMTKLPKNLLKKPEFKDKTLKQILEITERNNFELLNNKTINKHKNNLSEFCKYLITYKKVMKYNPFSNLEDLKTMESKKEIFDIVEIQRMFNDNEFFDNEDKDFLKIALCTGLRVSEISNIKKKDIKNNIISITDSKTKSGIRQIPIHSIIQDLEVFKNMKNLKEEDFIFYHGKTSDSISKKLNRKIKNFTNNNQNKTLHSFRGNFVSLLYKNKTFIPILKKLVGHTQKQDVTFYVYNKDFVDIEELIKAIENIDFTPYFSNYDRIKEIQKTIMDIL